MQQILPASDLDRVLATFSLPRRAAVRINPLRGEPPETIRRLLASGIELTPIDWSSHAFSIPEAQRETVSHLPAAEQGQVYLQSLSSQLAAVLLAPQPGDQVLDLAAAPGGKAAHLAALMQNDGLLSCVEPIKDRFYRLQANLKRQGVTIARFYRTDGRTVGKKVGPRFDRVLLDAPCSGEARFTTTEPASFETWSPRKIKETSWKQIGLIASAFESLKPGGRLLYATCSFAPEENEQVVASLLDRFPDSAELLPIDIPQLQPQESLAEPSATMVPIRPGLTTWEEEIFPADLRHTVRILPNEFYDGFFLALIKRR